MVVLMYEVIGYLLAGAFGSLARDCVKDNKLTLPHRENHELVLGFIGGMLIGAFVGWSVDQSFTTAALSGYVGVSAITHLLPKNSGK